MTTEQDQVISYTRPTGMRDYHYLWLCLIVLNVFTFMHVDIAITLVVSLLSICFGYLARQVTVVEDNLEKANFISAVHTSIFVKHNEALGGLYAVVYDEPQE